MVAGSARVKQLRSGSVHGPLHSVKSFGRLSGHWGLSADPSLALVFSIAQYCAYLSRMLARIAPGRTRNPLPL